MPRYFEGFVIGDDGRVAIADLPVGRFWVERPLSVDEKWNCGVPNGIPQYFYGPQAYTPEGKMLYIDADGRGYMKMYAYDDLGLAYSRSGQLLIDSVSPVDRFLGILPITFWGALAATIRGKPEPTEGEFVVTDLGAFVSMEDGTNLIT